MNDQDFIIDESKVADELGLARGKVRTARSEELSQGRDWKSVAGAVRYTQAGWARLMSVLKISASPPPVPPAPAAAQAEHSAPKNAVGHGLAAAAARAADPGPPRHGDVRQLVVVKIYAMNSRMLLATLGNGEVRCRVQDNRHFVRGMVIPARFIEADLWTLARRCPRWKGRW